MLRSRVVKYESVHDLLDLGVLVFGFCINDWDWYAPSFPAHGSSEKGSE